MPRAATETPLRLTAEEVTAIAGLPAVKRMWAGARRAAPFELESQAVDLCLWVDTDSSEIRAMVALPRDGGDEALLRVLVSAMVEPAQGTRPARPRSIGVDEERLLAPLARALKPVGIEVTLVSSEPFDQILSGFVEHFEQAPSYLDRPDVTPDCVKRFMEEAADLFRRRVWEHAWDSEMLRIEGLEVSPLIVSVLGRGGISLGLAIFLTEEAAATFLDDPTDEVALQIPSLHLSYEEDEEIVDEAEQHGWPIVDRDRVPILVRVDRMEEGLADGPSLVLATRVMQALSHWDPRVREPIQKEVEVDGRTVRVTWPHEGDLEPPEGDLEPPEGDLEPPGAGYLARALALFGEGSTPTPKKSARGKSATAAGGRPTGKAEGGGTWAEGGRSTGRAEGGTWAEGGKSTGKADGGKSTRKAVDGKANGLTTYEMKVTLKGSRPAIWRRIQIPGHATLDDLHHVLQQTMGWEDCHLHAFTIKGTCYGDDDAPTNVALATLGLNVKDKFEYCYDFGDDWDHVIHVEKVLHLEKPLKHAVCLKGSRACPPEDCGGIWSYQNRLAGENPDEDEMLDGFDPAYFHADDVNHQLKLLKLG